jgi:hypothetical protein
MIPQRLGWLAGAICFLVPTNVQAETQTALIASLKTSTLNSLIDELKTSTLPKLVDGLNKITNGTLAANGFRLNPTDMTVSIASSDTQSSFMNRARVSIQARNIKIDVGNVNLTLFKQWFGSCSIRASATVKAPLLSIALDIGVPDPDKPELRFSVASVDLSTIDLDLLYEGSGLCNTGTVESFEPLLKTLFDGSFRALLDQAVHSQFLSMTLNTVQVAKVLGVDVIDGGGKGIGIIDPTIRIGRLYSTTTAITLGLSTSLAATLTKPAWRAGSRHAPAIASPKSGTVPSLKDTDIDFRVAMTFDGINALLGTVWYMFWATLSDNPASLTSSLCRVTATDACVFPPYLLQIKRRTWEFRLLKVVFPLFKNFRLEAVVEPPVLSSTITGQIGGAGSGKVQIVGDGLRRTNVVLALFDMKVSTGLSVPTFNVTSGSIQNLTVLDFQVEALGVDVFPGTRRRRQSLERKLRRLFRFSSGILDDIVAELLPRVNDEVDLLLQKFKIELPILKDLPLPGQQVSFHPSKTSVAETSLGGGVSVLEMASDLSVQIDNTTTAKK